MGRKTQLILLLVAFLAYTSALVRRPRSTLCERRGPGRFITDDCKSLCTCRRDGSFYCSTLCTWNRVSCNGSQRRVTFYKEISGSSKCTCPKQKCVPRRLPGTCVVRDKLYKVGTFITDDCTAECECRSNGEYGCVALCPTGRITCRPGERKITVQVPARGSSRCTCPYLRCVSAGSLSSSRSNGGTCNLNGKYYKVGKFITEDCSGDCVCSRSGRFRCNSLCPPLSELCRSGEKEVIVQVPIGRGSNCKCPVQRCAPAGTCKVRGKIYQVGKFITDDCTAECDCQSDGRYGCKSLCPTGSVTCRAGQRKVMKHVTVSPKCTCPVPQCVSEVLCDVRGKKYKVGRFITDDCSARCHCRRNGRYGCRSLCPRSRISCSYGQRKITVYEAVGGSSNCQCRKEKCI